MKTNYVNRLVFASLFCAGALLVWHNLQDSSSTPGLDRPENVPVTAKKSRETRAPKVNGQRAVSMPIAEPTHVIEDVDLAPEWSVKFGSEFWRRQAPELGIVARSSNAAGKIVPPFNLNDVIDRVDHALTLDPAADQVRLDAGNYTIRFDGQGGHFSPYRMLAAGDEEETAPSSSLVSDSATEVLFRTLAVQRGGEDFCYHGGDAKSWSIVGNTAQALLSADLGIVEHYEANRDGVAVTWIFSKPLPGTGPVQIVASVDGLRYAGESEGGYHFADNAGVARVRVGRAVAVDAAGTRWDLTMQAQPESGQLTVELPAEIQAEAAYPLAIDPIIGPEFGMDQPVSTTASGSQGNAAVASAAGTYLVVWDDNRNNGATGRDIYGARVSATGAVLDPLGIAICTASEDQNNPSVAASGTTFLVAWHDLRLGNDNIFGARVTTKGVVLDPYGFAVSVSPDGEFNPAVAGGPSGFFVVWEDDRNQGANGTDIYGARVTLAGFVTDPAGIAVSTNATDQLLPTVVSSSGAFFVAWQDSRNNGTTGTDVYGARVSSAGAVLDPVGVPLSTAGGNQTEVAAAANGGLVLVAWRDRRTSGASSDDIYGTRLNFTNNAANVLDPAGIAISTNVASQRTPAVCALSNNFLVVWRDRRNSGATSDDIYGARVSANGVVLEPTGFAICTNAASQTAPAVASVSSGALVAWTDPRNANTGNDIYGARISVNGTVASTNDIPISLAGAVESAPAVAFNGTNYLVVWQDERNFATNDVDILGTRVSAAGKVLDLHGINICTQLAAQRNPAVAASGGEFLVAWEDSRNALSTGVDIYGTRVDGAGTVLDPAGLALSTAANDEAMPAVAGNPTTFLVAWEDNRGGGAPDIYATRVSQGGIISNPSGLPISATGGNEIHPAISASADQFLVVWEDNNDIFAARVTSAGTLLDPSGSAIQLAGQGSESVPSVAALGTNFLVAWQDDRNFSSDIYAARVFGDGSVPDFDGFPVCTLPNDQLNPAVAANSNTWLIVWQNRGPKNVDNDLYSARVSADGIVQDFLSVPLLGSGDRVTPGLAFGGAGKFLLVSEAFRNNSRRVAANLMTADPLAANTFVQFKAASFAVLESGKFAKVTVAVKGKFTGVVTVDFATEDGTAVAGVDYLPVTARLVFSNKKTATVITIPIIDDLTLEPNKTVTLTLQNPTGGALLGPAHTATLTILE